LIKKVDVPESQKGEQTLIELSERYQVHSNQIAEWKKLLLEHAPDIFSKNGKTEQGPDVKELHAKIGQLRLQSKERRSLTNSGRYSMC